MKSSAIGRERSQFKRGKKKKKKSESNESSCVTISISFRGNVVEVENIGIETIFSIFSRAHCALDNTLKEGNGEKRYLSSDSAADIFAEMPRRNGGTKCNALKTQRLTSNSLERQQCGIPRNFT